MSKINLTVMTADEARDLKLQQTKREVKGNDFRCHSGARSQVHQNKRKIVERFDKRRHED